MLNENIITSVHLIFNATVLYIVGGFGVLFYFVNLNISKMLMQF